MDKPIKFTFRFINANGGASLLSKRGRFDGAELSLGKHTIAAHEILNLACANGRLALEVCRDDKPPEEFVLANIPGRQMKRLHHALVVASSTHRAAMHQDELEQRGEADTFRIEVCSACEATVDLSGCEATRQFHCRYCSTLTTRDGKAPPDEAKLHHCAQCGYYARPKQFSIAYVLFAVFFIASQAKCVRVCHPCIRPEAWKMLFGSLLFPPLLPVAIVQVIRAYRGGTARCAAYEDLDRANIAARKGSLLESAAIYDGIAGALPAAAGLHYNQGLAHLKAGQALQAAEQFERALKDCANYEPARDMLKQCRSQIEQTTQARRADAA